MVRSAHDLDTMMLLRHAHKPDTMLLLLRQADNCDTMLLLLLRHGYKNGHNDAAAHNPWCNAAAAVLCCTKCKALKLRVDFPVLCHRDACMSFSLIASLLRLAWQTHSPTHKAIEPRVTVPLVLAHLWDRFTSIRQ